MSPQETIVYSPYRWLLHILTVSYFLMGFIVRFAWPPMDSVAGPELGMDMTRVGSYMSAFYIGYVLIQIPAGVLGDRFGVRGVIALALLGEGLTSIAMGMIDSYSMGFVLRLLAGLSAGMVYASCVRCVSRWFPPGEYGMAFAFLLLAPMGGVLLANLIVPWLMGMWSWRGAFVAIGILALSLSLVSVLLLRDMGSADRGRNFFEGLRYVLSQRVLLMCSLSGFCHKWAQVSFVSWGNSYLRSIEFSPSKAGFIMMVFGIGGCIGTLISGWLGDRILHPKQIMIVALLLIIPLAPFFGSQTDMTTLMLAAGTCGVVMGIGNPPLVMIIASYAGRDWSATAGGVSGCIFQCGAIFGPLLIGMSIDVTNSYTTGWWMMSAGALVGLFFLLPVPKLQRA
ncbi:MAG: MFS transporter [Azoarcus sp.]|jgi:sugar phosphate permease|nr:MFS transporter [Azoarcus sp.]